MLEILLKDDNWFPAAAVISLIASAVVIIRARRRRAAAWTTATAACNLFFGLMIGILGIGHLFAVTTKTLLGILPPHIHLWFAIPFGFALTVPAWWLTIEAGHLLTRKASAIRNAMWLNASLAIVLASAGPSVALAVLAGVNMLLLLLSRRSKLPAAV